MLSMPDAKADIGSVTYPASGQPRLLNGAIDPNWGGNDVTRRRYINQEDLLDAHLIDLNARIYDPALGKFLTPDPIIADISNSQAWNPYDYAGNNPTWNISGLVYLPHSSVTLSGAVNKSSQGLRCLELVVDNVTINGTGSIFQNDNQCQQAGLNQTMGGSRGMLVN